ncbi:hypothetical protein [Anabaena azotica]|uniref:WxL domain-containing protein n=1 Tax=Anabaena azotica FACHB-119 TaxID=947527 RepID=A0ABR8D1D1_9NOST|nr:hypothetical protein [Anabaena azotica]MBD2500231.1 hypothetical protein [Anabaena azotica FACHB-119]
MKNKILALAVAGAALGTAAISAPAQAQIQGTATNIGVTVTVPEVLYLRTVSQININLTPDDFGLSGVDPVTGGYYGSGQGGTADPSGSNLDTDSPFDGLNTSFDKTIPNVYAIWSNSPRNVVTATVGIGTNPGTSIISGIRTAFGTPTATSTNVAQTTAPGLTGPGAVGSVALDLDLLNNVTAGDYSGTITVTAAAP